MINPGVLVDAIVVKLRAIPDLVMEMDGEATHIQPYHYRYPKEASLARALHDAGSPSILVVYRGTDPGRLNGGEVWKHRFSLFIRSGEVADADPATAGYYRLLELIISGVPTGGDGQRMLYTVIHPTCYPMDLPRMVAASDIEGIDFFEAQFSLTEIGDN
jgi:hypothetical protein